MFSNDFKWPNICPLSKEEWHCIKNKYNLTVRELVLCMYLCMGLSYKDTAKSMDIKVSTVKMHLSKVFLKVGVNTKIMLLLTFLQAQIKP